MTLSNLLPLVSTLISFGFAIAVLRRYAMRHGRHLLVWGIGLLFYGIGTLAEFYSSRAWSPLFFRLWYIGGALLTAAWLGQGTVYLLVRRKAVANGLMIALAAISLIGAGLVFAKPLNAAAFNPTLPLSAPPAAPQYRQIMDTAGPLRALTIFFNIYGTLGLVGGALYSSYLFWRKRVLANRVLGNILIAAGGLMPAAGGTFILLGGADFLYLSEMVGAILMFIGFMQATARAPGSSEPGKSLVGQPGRVQRNP